MRKQGRKKNITQNYVGKGKKYGRNSKSKRLVYDENMMFRAQTKFDLILGGMKNPWKKKVNALLKTICSEFAYNEDYKKFRQALKRRLDYFKPDEHGTTGNKRGRPQKRTEEQELQIVGWIRDMAAMGAPVTRQEICEEVRVVTAGGVKPLKCKQQLVLHKKSCAFLNRCS